MSSPCECQAAVWTMIDTCSLECLIDTGVSVSVMRDDVRCRLIKVVMPYEGHTLRGADGCIILILGQCTSGIVFSGSVYSVEFEIFLYCAHAVILGWDVLSTVDAVIDCC